ncbi:proto-oncogene c-Rel-like [Anastrepha obliqua]|uniref:proto-oncogene c-Rel-like n=1 Tax=Anastrepha obliqua TaxID=95512 RepID=UPI00240A47D3|nr:proto-oncogene c-Rel-like [Anastrepha obliqua]
MSSKKRSASASMSKKSSVSPRRLLRETLKHQTQQNTNSNCDPGEQQTPNRNTNEESSKPYVRIVEHPADKWFKFRYSSDSQTSSMLLGENWSPSRETYPAIEILNYKGRAVVIISCVTEDAPYKPHPHTILNKDGYIHGVCILQIPHRAEFHSLGIKSTKRSDVDMALKKRESIRVDPFETGFSHRLSPHCIDLNVVRLCFQVFIADENGHLTVPLKPVVTKPIYDKRSLLRLAIHEICCSGSVLGCTEIILLCNKVVKEDVSVRFYEEQNGVTTWEAFGSFEIYDVHKQSSIRLKTPRYHNINITKPVTVFVQLVRASDGIASDPVQFTYKPVEPESNLMLLRRKCERIGLNPQVNIPLKLGNAPSGVSFPLFNFNNSQLTPPPEVKSPSNTSSSSPSAPSSPSSSSSTFYLPSSSPSPSLHTMVTGRNTSSIPAFIAARGGGDPPETKQVPVAANRPNANGMAGACQQLQQQQQQHQIKPQYLALQEVQQSIPPQAMPNGQQHYQQPQPQQQTMLQYLSPQECQQATPPRNMPILQQHYRQSRPQPQQQQQQHQTKQQYFALSKTQQATPPQNMPIVQQHYQQSRPQPHLQRQKYHEKSQYFALWEAQQVTPPQNMLDEQQHYRKPQLQQQQHQTKLQYFALSKTQQATPPQNMPIVQQHYQQPRPQPQFQLQQHQTRLQYLEVSETQKATPPQNMSIEQQHYRRPKPQPQPQLQQQQQQTRLQYLALQETQQPPPQNMPIVQQHYQQPQPQNQTQPNATNSTNKTSWEQQFANVVLFAASALSNLNGNSTESNMRNFLAATASGIIQHEQQQQQPQLHEQHLSSTQQQQYQPLKTEPQWESQSQMLQQQLINNEVLIKTHADVGSFDFVGDDDEDETITTLLNIDSNELIHESRVEQAILQLTNDELELSASINKSDNFEFF